MGLYLSSGYLDIEWILSKGLPFNLVPGGRGIGKTYGALKYVIEHNIKFIFMRRTQSQLDIINKPEFCPFKALNSDMGWSIYSKALTKYNAGFYECTEEDGKLICQGAPLGYSVALSTVSNIRGFDASDVELMIYDEFIPERHERPIKNEAAAFLNAYETINRNRELQGRKPLQVLCLANSNDIANPLFLELGLVRKVEQMRKRGQEVALDEKRGIGLFLINKSPISVAKQKTALYQLSAGSDFERMAISNQFVQEDASPIKSRPLREYKPVVHVGELTVYEHKSNHTLYVSTHASGTPPTYGTGEVELGRFKRAFGWIWLAYMDNSIEFEESLCEILLTKYYS